MDKEYYIKKWLEGTLTDQERREFESTGEYKSLEKLSRTVQKFKAPEYNEEEELQRFHARPKAKERHVKVNWLRPFLQVAAAITFIIVAYFYFISDSKVVVETFSAEKKEIFLPDSSKVILNAHSRLSYSEDNWTKRRAVELKGEAFFDVAKGSTFDVKTSSGTISVLGTEFNVMSRDNYFEVVCYEGLVRVESGKHDVKLSPAHAFKIVEGKVGSEELSADEPAWVDGKSVFNSVPFKYVIEEFERQYDVSVVSGNVDMSSLFTGGFVHSDMPLALKSITLPLNLTYEIKENKQVVLSGGIE